MFDPDSNFLLFDQPAEKIFTLTTVYGQKCCYTRYWHINTWIRDNTSGDWDFCYERDEDHNQIVARYAFERKEDAALFKLFWSNDIEP